MTSRVRVWVGDCIEVLRTLPAGAVDAVVTDPPYAISFMGKTWDDHGSPVGYQQWCVEWATECLRVMKPGAHLVAFGGTRTHHRLFCALEDAGFEIRDSLMWAYGQGFPKSLAPYRKMTPCRLIESVPHAVRLSEWHPLGTTPTALALVETQPEGDLAVAIRTGREDGSSEVTVTSLSDWTMGGMSWNTVSSCRGYSADLWQRTSTSIIETMIAATTDPRTWKSCTSLLTDASTRRAETPADGCGCAVASVATSSSDGSWKWNGTRRRIAPEPATSPLAPLRELGTSLKPAHEPIVLARKPLTSTVAANVLAHGTGALNIDGCRLAMNDEDREVVDNRSGAGFGSTVFTQIGRPEGKYRSAPGGRWPANAVLTHAEGCNGACQPGCPVGEVDRQSGERKAGGKVRGSEPSRPGQNGIYGVFPGQVETTPYQDTGGASRFFPVFEWADADDLTTLCYTAKASRAERPRIEGTDLHPTVKPLALMRWLIRLVCPPGGLILDPFAGTGTTGEAAVLENRGYRAALIEREPGYVPLIEARLARSEAAVV